MSDSPPGGKPTRIRTGPFCAFAQSTSPKPTAATNKRGSAFTVEPRSIAKHHLCGATTTPRNPARSIAALTSPSDTAWSTNWRA